MKFLIALVLISFVAVVLSADETADIQADVKDVLNGKDKETVSSEDDIEADANVDVKKAKKPAKPAKADSEDEVEETTVKSKKKSKTTTAITDEDDTPTKKKSKVTTEESDSVVTKPSKKKSKKAEVDAEVEEDDSNALIKSTNQIGAEIGEIPADISAALSGNIDGLASKSKSKKLLDLDSSLNILA